MECWEHEQLLTKQLLYYMLIAAGFIRWLNTKS